MPYQLFSTSAAVDQNVKNLAVSSDDVHVGVNKHSHDGNGTYVVPFSVQSMITQTDKSGQQIKHTNTVCTLSDVCCYRLRAFDDFQFVALPTF